MKTPFDFTGEVALITGAATGIGFEIGRQLASAGASLLLNDIDPVLCQQAAEKIRSQGGRCVACPGHAGDIGLIQEWTDRAIGEYGRLDIAIANAGITTYGTFLDYSPGQFEQLIQTNLYSSFFLAQAAAKKMKEQPEGGSILFMSSVTGHQAHPFLAAYGMTKAALQMLAKALVPELAPKGISVNSLSPGATLTDRTVTDPDYEKVWNSITPSGKASTTADIAHAALFLVSKSSRQITGHTLIVDGGWTSVSPSPDLEIPK